MITILKEVLADIAKLKDKQTAASATALVLTLLAAVIGADTGAWAPAVAGALVLVGTVVAYLEKKSAVKDVKAS